MKDRSLLSHLGRHPEATCGTVNIPVYRASTIISSSLQAYAEREQHRFDDICYGAFGTPTTFALTEAVNALDQGAGAVVASSGLGACTMSLLAFVSAGDHVLVTDAVYGPTRHFCDVVLRRFGIETSYYDPNIGAEIETLIKANTRAIFLEAPGSQTFEMQDIPAITAVAQRHGCVTLIDNTWATSLYFKPLLHGVDIAIQAATKYISGHSDIIMGVASARTPELYTRLKESYAALGEITSPDDCYLALRGLRSMSARMSIQQVSALTIARWFEARSEVARVLYPPLENDPGHALWKRDYTGAGSLFGVVLKEKNPEAVARMIDNYRIFGIGASWGGYESLVLTADPVRSIHPWQEAGTLVRYAIGLEDLQDLLADLDDGFKRLSGK